MDPQIFPMIFPLYPIFPGGIPSSWISGSGWNGGWALSLWTEKWWTLSVGMMKFPIWWESHKSHVPNHQPETQHLVSTRSVCGFWRTFNIEVLLNLSCSNPIESPLLWHFGMVSLSFFAPSHGLCFANPRTNGSWGSGGACRNVFVCFFLKSNVIQQYPTCIYGKIPIYIYMYEMYTCSKYNIQNINIPMI